MVVTTNAHLLDNSAKLWRYIGFSKFVSLLASQRLYFTRADKFVDTFESSIPKNDIEAARNYYAALLANDVIDVGGVSKFPKTDIKVNLKHFLKMSDAEVEQLTDRDLPPYLLKISNRFQYVNCWHANEHESAGMWQLYMNGNEGVAIQTTAEALYSCLNNHDDTIYYGPVKYIDYMNDSWGEPLPLNPIFHKRNSFAHEREVRAVIINPKGVDPKYHNGVEIPVDLKCMVQQVVVNPHAQRWFKDTVASVCKQYGLEVTPTQSGLYDEPGY
jgi:hypothetical protein